METIEVKKSGAIIGIGRYTEIPFAALELSEYNIMHPQLAVKREFKCKTSKRVE